MKIEIVFENKNNEKFSLFWETTENPITFLWLKKILKIFKSDFDVKTRWSGFQFEDRKNEYLLKRLKNCVDIINACEYIDFKMPKLEVNEYSVDLHNQYHHYFEILMGKTWQYSKYIEEAKKRNDLLILQAISGLNEFSHEIIDSQINFPNITVCFLSDKIKNYFLPDHADNYFTLENDFGGLYLHYAQIGKSWLDFLIDNDNVITKEEIEPLKNINGDFDLCFLNSLKKGNENYKNFFSFLEERLHAYNENIENKKLRLGRILLAYPLFNENEEIFNKIKDFNKIKTMTFIGKNKIITKVFSYCQEMV